MYRLLGFFFALLLLNGCETPLDDLYSSWSHNDSIDYAQLKLKYPISIENTSTYESVILGFEKNDWEHHTRDSVVLFIGSSTIALWNDRLNTDFPSRNVVGHGFGGSTMMDQHYYFDRIVRPLRVKKCVLYCENDIGSNTQRIFDLFRYFDYRFHEQFPKTPLCIVSFKPSVARSSLIPQMREVNDSLSRFASLHRYTRFVDVFHPMMPHDTIEPSLYGSDGLHMSRKGYDIWIAALKPLLDAR